MKTWERLTRTQFCGGCGELQPVNTPVQRWQLPSMTRQLLRCERCAGEAPPELPEVIVKHQTAKRMQPAKRVAQAVIDKWLPYKERDDPKEDA